MGARITSIESFRALAIFGVILWHTDLLGRLAQLGRGNLLVEQAIVMVWWISVPYFFMAAGYFFANKVREHGRPFVQLRRYFSSLVWVFLAWLCIYIVIPGNWMAAVREHGWWEPFYAEAVKNLHLLATQHLSVFLAPQPPLGYLWFLPALVFSLAFLTVLAVCRLQPYLILLIIGLYIVALAEEVSVAYSLHLPIQLGLWSIALLCTALGWWQAGRHEPPAPAALYLIAGGYACAVIEGAILREAFHSSPLAMFKHHYVGGILLTLGIFLLTLARPNLGKSTPLPFLGQFTLGVYVSHILIINTLVPISTRLQNQSLPWQFVFALSVYFLAILFIVILSKVPIARRLVFRSPTGQWTRNQMNRAVPDKSLISNMRREVGPLPRQLVTRTDNFLDGQNDLTLGDKRIRSQVPE